MKWTMDRRKCISLHVVYFATVFSYIIYIECRILIRKRTCNFQYLDWNNRKCRTVNSQDRHTTAVSPKVFPSESKQCASCSPGVDYPCCKDVEGNGRNLL
jgi:hypothetical protein